MVISEGYYGIAVITHCCLESHGSVAEWTGPDTLKTYFSTQNVSGLPGEIGEALRQAGIDVKDNNIETICQYIGGGFGSKFSPDRWGIENARLAKIAGKPVKLMLERDMELEVAGARPSSFAKIKVAAKKDGTIVAWDRIPGALGARQAPPCLPFPTSSPAYPTRSLAIPRSARTPVPRAPGGPQPPAGGTAHDGCS